MAAQQPRPTAPGLPRAHNPEDIDIPAVSVLYIGPPKSGKTTCALSYPKPFVLYFEENKAGLIGTHDLRYLTVADMQPEPIAALQQIILPTIARGGIGDIVGDFEPRTIVFDSLTELFGTHMSRAVRGAKESLKGFDDFATFLYRSENFLVNHVLPLTRLGFNVVATCHIADIGGEPIMQKVGEKWEQVGREPLYRRPAIPGRFRDLLCSRFDAVFLTSSELVAERNDKGTVTGRQVESYYVSTINPDRTYEGIGDGLGKEGGRFRKLPPRIDGRYPALAKAWGFTK